MEIYFKNRKLKIAAKKTGFFGKISGLMFKSKETENLLFEFSSDTRKAIHSFFVFYPFFALWLDERNRVLDYKAVSPFRFHIAPERKYRKLLEIPFNEKNEKILGYFVKNSKYRRRGKI